jgi:hypothetical protein
VTRQTTSGRLWIHVIALVVSIEGTGETTVEVHHNDPRYTPRLANRSAAIHEAMLKMHELAVGAVQQWNDPENGKDGQLFLTISAGVSSDPDQLNEIVVEWAVAKVKKLRETKADERHLFVWIDSSHDEAEPAFATLPPPKAPTLPEGVDVLWLVELTGWPNYVSPECAVMAAPPALNRPDRATVRRQSDMSALRADMVALIAAGECSSTSPSRRRRRAQPDVDKREPQATGPRRHHSGKRAEHPDAEDWTRDRVRPLRSTLQRATHAIWSGHPRGGLDERDV